MTSEEKRDAADRRTMDAMNAYAERALAARKKQGLPERVTDRDALDRIGDLLVPTESDRRRRESSPKQRPAA